MKKRFYLLFLYIFIFLNVNAQMTVTGSIMHGNIVRKYRLHFPPNFNKSKKLPLIFNFHGFTSNAAQQELYSGMNMIADTANFIVCYPEGINAAWNVGWAFGSTADDVGFTEALIANFQELYNIDLQKVFACGMSNGGFMSYTLGCELNNKICAIASVTGSMEPNYLKKCRPGRSIPVMEIHGTADPTVNYNGTIFISSPISDVLKFWQENNNCDVEPDKLNVLNVNTNDNSTAEKWVYKNCSNDHQISHFKVLGGGHTWPGSVFNNGITCQDFNASEEIWLFFKQFSLPEISSTQQGNENEIVNIFPNPFNNFIRIESKTNENLMVTIFDNQGKVWFHNENVLQQEKLEVDNLPIGFYVVSITDHFGKTKTFKLIKT